MEEKEMFQLLIEVNVAKQENISLSVEMDNNLTTVNKKLQNLRTEVEALQLSPVFNATQFNIQQAEQAVQLSDTLEELYGTENAYVNRATSDSNGTAKLTQSELVADCNRSSNTSSEKKLAIPTKIEVSCELSATPQASLSTARTINFGSIELNSNTRGIGPCQTQLLDETQATSISPSHVVLIPDSSMTLSTPSNSTASRLCFGRATKVTPLTTSDSSDNRLATTSPASKDSTGSQIRFIPQAQPVSSVSDSLQSCNVTAPSTILLEESGKRLTISSSKVVSEAIAPSSETNQQASFVTPQNVQRSGVNFELFSTVPTEVPQLFQFGTIFQQPGTNMFSVPQRSTLTGTTAASRRLIRSKRNPTGKL